MRYAEQDLISEFLEQWDFYANRTPIREQISPRSLLESWMPARRLSLDVRHELRRQLLAVGII